MCNFGWIDKYGAKHECNLLYNHADDRGVTKPHQCGCGVVYESQEPHTYRVGCGCITCNTMRAQYGAMWEALEESSVTALRGSQQPKPERTMQQTPYEVLVLRDVPDANAPGETNTTIALAPQLILATGPQIARDKAIRALTEDAAADLNQLRVFVREFASNVPARW